MGEKMSAILSAALLSAVLILSAYHAERSFKTAQIIEQMLRDQGPAPCLQSLHGKISNDLETALILLSRGVSVSMSDEVAAELLAILGEKLHD